MADESAPSRLDVAKAFFGAIAKQVKETARPEDGTAPTPGEPNKTALVDALFALVPPVQHEAAMAAASDLTDAELLECLRGLNPEKNSSISVYFSHAYWRDLFVRAKRSLDESRVKKET